MINARKKTAVLLIVALVILFAATTRVTITGNYEGIFLLRGRNGALLEIKDDLFLNEARRYLFGIDLERDAPFMKAAAQAAAGGTPSLYFEWNEKKGDGFVRSYLGNGKQLLTCFGRYIDDGGSEVSGLFVGGGLPRATKEEAGAKLNETGMAYFNGERWLHIWCTANEAISNFSSFKPFYPSGWKFLGSRVLLGGPDDIIVESSHEILNDGVPLHMDRYASFRAGTGYFLLQIVVTNAGDRPTSFFYLYGDEPWLGNYGTSAGNVGWAADGLHKFEGYLDGKKFHYAGLYDYGNDAIGEPHTFTRAANFIEWFGSEQPLVFFSNDILFVPNQRAKTPLKGNARFFGLNWGPKALEPGQSATYTLAIGMAGHDDRTDMPVMPKVEIRSFP